MLLVLIRVRFCGVRLTFINRFIKGRSTTLLNLLDTMDKLFRRWGVTDFKKAFDRIIYKYYTIIKMFITC